MKGTLALPRGWAWAVGAVIGMGAVLAWTARAPEAGLEWRAAFVAAALGAVPLTLWAVRRLQPEWRLVLGVALALRLLALPLAPTLSDDGHRYLWDGALVARGENPYARTPREVAADGAAPLALEALNSPDYHSVYPPVSQGAFALAWWAGGGSQGRAWWAYKLLIVALELWALWALWGVIGRPLAMWAWHPLVVIEVAGQGHTEGLALACLGLAVAALARGREGRAGAWGAVTGAVKLWPFAVVGLWGLTRRRTLAVALGLGAVLLAPLALHGGGAAESLGLYAGTFDFYSLPYAAIKSALWPLAGEASGRLASGAMGAALVGVLGLLAWRTRQRPLAPVPLAASATLAITLLSPTLHPWHLLPALWAVCVWPNSPLRRAVLWLTGLAPVTYLAYVVDGPLATAATVLGWGGAAAFAWRDGRHRLVDAALRARGRAKWRRLRPLVGPADSILDLGCGEGYVGAAAHADGYRVMLSDLEDARRVDLPFVHADDPLPEVDATILVFVLHHAESPEAVLKRAMESSQRVVVWESVPGHFMTKPLLQLVDQLANGQRDHAMQRADIRTVEEWEATFGALGIAYRRIARWGIGHPQAIWVLERGANRSSAPSD